MKINERDLKEIKRIIKKLEEIQLTNEKCIENEDSLHFLRIAYSSIQSKMMYDKFRKDIKS